MSHSLPTPKVWAVADGAWQVRLPLPWDLVSVNVFLFRRGGDFLLLDSGILRQESLLSLEAALLHVGAGWAAIGEILVSHLHPDHIGAAAEIRRRSGAPVRMPGREADLVKPLGPGRAFFAEAAAFLRCHGVPADHVETMRRHAATGREQYERLVVDGTIEEGERVEFDGGTLEAVAAPGHSPGLLCFYCPEQRVLFSTDAILPKVTPNIGVQWFYQQDPLGDYLRSLEKLEALDARLTVPSHGRPFRGHQEWIENTRLHHARRCETILDAIGDRTLDAYSIAAGVWESASQPLERRFAMSEGLSHLEYLQLLQQVEKVDGDGVFRWRRT